ncbi:MAG TPA: hypothetical protein VIY71_01340 [Solirubrobacterales bacterium]
MQANVPREIFTLCLPLQLSGAAQDFHFELKNPPKFNLNTCAFAADLRPRMKFRRILGIDIRMKGHYSFWPQSKKAIDQKFFAKYVKKKRQDSGIWGNSSPDRNSQNQQMTLTKTFARGEL